MVNPPGFAEGSNPGGPRPKPQGIHPGRSACVMFGYKPGWHTFYDESEDGPSSDSCAVPGSGMWTGPAHVCGDGAAPGGLFDPTRYRRGEYEQAVSDFIREMLQTLADHGYRDIRIATGEAPPYRNKFWSILDADVRSRPQMLGVWMGRPSPRSPNSRAAARAAQRQLGAARASRRLLRAGRARPHPRPRRAPLRRARGRLARPPRRATRRNPRGGAGT
jgi:hypothetical protein